MEQHTTPAEDQTHEAASEHLIVTPTFEAGDGALYVHKDLVKVREPWAEAEHIGPIDEAERFGDVESWAGYLGRFGKRPLVTWNAEGLHAVLDYHSDDGSPNRCDWWADYPFVPSLEWEAWMQLASGAAVGHRKAVEFLEDHSPDILEPIATDLMGLLRSLRANVTANAQTELRPDGTTNVSFAENKTVSGGAGHVALPSEITIGIPVLKGHIDEAGAAVNYRLTVRLRASVDDGAHLSLRFSIPLAERVLEDVYAERIAKARELVSPDIAIWRAAD